jgi:hypothetical protein
MSYFPSGTPVPDLLTEAEAVKYLRLDEVGIKHPSATLRRYRNTGALRAVQVSKQVLYPLEELKSFISNQTEVNPR